MDKSSWEPQEGFLEEVAVNLAQKEKKGGKERHSKHLIREAGEYLRQQWEVWCSWRWAGDGRRGKRKSQAQSAKKIFGARLGCCLKGRKDKTRS